MVTHVFEGDLPDLGISFIGVDDETQYDFAVDMSGYDGELYLMQLPQSNG